VSGNLCKKTAKRHDSTQILSENTFKAIFEDLFDMAPVDALQKINNEEDREFLRLQRQKGRIGSMGAIDVKLLRKEKRIAERAAKYQKRKERSETEMKTSKFHEHFFKLNLKHMYTICITNWNFVDIFFFLML